MSTHPWTMYEVARASDEARLLRARSAMRAVELREEPWSAQDTADPQSEISWLDRLLRRGGVVAERAPAGSGTA